MIDFGYELKNMRIEKHISQRKLADKVGVVEFSISRYETGKVLPQLDIAEKILDALGYKLVIVRK